jgi:uncharacterized membrane protein
MNSKTAAIVSYITIIGWLIAYFTTQGTPERNDFSKYHLKQSFGLGLVGAALNIISWVFLPMFVTSYSSAALFGNIFLVLGLAVFVFWLLGLLNAANDKMAPIPLIGKFFEDKFNFIDK